MATVGHFPAEGEKGAQRERFISLLKSAACTVFLFSLFMFHFRNIYVSPCESLAFGW